MYQGQLGADFGSLSLDGVLSWAKDAVALSSFGGSNIACLTPANCFINVNNQFFDPNTVLRATLSNNLGGEVGRQIQVGPVHALRRLDLRAANEPVRRLLTGFPTISQGIFIPPGFFNKTASYTNRRSRLTIRYQRVLNTFWFGARWKIRSDLEAWAASIIRVRTTSTRAPARAQAPSSAAASAREARLECRSCSTGSRSSASISTPAYC